MKINLKIGLIIGQDIHNDAILLDIHNVENADWVRFFSIMENNTNYLGN